MKRTHATILMVVAGLFVCFLIVSVSLGAWFFAYAFERDTPDPATASAALDDVRRRFAGQDSVFEIINEDDARVRRPPPDSRPARQLEHLKLLIWDADEGALTSVTLPFWLLRLKAGPIDLSSHVMVDGHGIDLTVDQVERYGPALLVDHETGRGDRLLIWTE
jgi:hypothetical protein